MINQKITISLLTCGFLFVSTLSFSMVDRVRVINKTNKTIYIHKGGYAPSAKIESGKWRIFYYPFSLVPPNTKNKISSSLLVATSGGRWITTPNGYTYLKDIDMIACLDYSETISPKKSGNRTWTIKNAEQVDKNCQITGYKQKWYQAQ